MKVEPAGTSSLLDDATTLQCIRNFISAAKPEDVGPVDVLQVITLMVRKAEDHAVFDSQNKLAESFGCDAKTIVRSQKRLEKLGWLSRPARLGRTRALSLNFENVPGEEPVRLKITPLSRQLTARYMVGLQKQGRRKFPKFWVQQQLPSAQRILDRCGGDIELAAAILSHASGHEQHRRHSSKGLYTVLGRWPKILKSLKSYQEKERQRGEQAKGGSSQPHAAWGPTEGQPSLDNNDRDVATVAPEPPPAHAMNCEHHTSYDVASLVSRVLALLYQHPEAGEREEWARTLESLVREHGEADVLKAAAAKHYYGAACARRITPQRFIQDFDSSVTFARNL